MKTNFQMMNELKNWFPKHRGYISGEEADHIRARLEINENRSVVELRNLRDFTVLILDKWNQKNISDGDWDAHIKHSDRISAITAVIDSELFNRGEEV